MAQTVAGEDASTSNKGIASFLAADFDVTAGAVSLEDTVVKLVGSDSGNVIPLSHTFNIIGGTGIDTSGSGANLTVAVDGAVVGQTITGDTGGALSPTAGNWNILGGEGIDISGAGSTLTVAGEDASITNKGIASFLAADFDVASGAVSLEDTVLKSAGSDSGTATPSGHSLTFAGTGGIATSATGSTVTIDGSGISGGGAWVFISSQTASSSASIEFTGLSSTYYLYMIVITGVVPATNNVDFWMRTSTNNGSSYDASSAYDYGVQIQKSVGGAIDGNGSGGTSADQIVLNDNADSLGNNTNEIANWKIWLYDPSATTYTYVNFEGAMEDQSGDIYSMTGHGVRTSAADVDAIQFLMESGNIASGTFKLYGLLAS